MGEVVRYCWKPSILTVRSSYSSSSDSGTYRLTSSGLTVVLYWYSSSGTGMLGRHDDHSQSQDKVLLETPHANDEDRLGDLKLLRETLRTPLCPLYQLALQYSP
jgi:hypothetical protein